jgi:hypothetical protein
VTNGTRKGLALAVARSSYMAALICCVLASCQAIRPTNNTLKDLQESATPEPLDHVSPPHEQKRAKAAMVRWLEQYLKNEYRVLDQHYVLTAPGATDGAAIGSKAYQHITQSLGGKLQTDGWFDDENYMLFLFTFDEASPRYIAFVMTREFLPGTHERRMVGYFELVVVNDIHARAPRGK